MYARTGRSSKFLGSFCGCLDRAECTWYIVELRYGQVGSSKSSSSSSNSLVKSGQSIIHSAAVSWKVSPPTLSTSPTELDQLNWVFPERHCGCWSLRRPWNLSPLVIVKKISPTESSMEMLVSDNYEKR